MTSRQLARALRRAQARVETKQPRFENAVRLAIRDSIKTAARRFEQKVTSFVASTGEPPGWSPPEDDELLSLDEVMAHYRGKTDPIRNASVNDFFDAFGDEAERNGVRANWHVSNPLVAAELERTGSQITQVAETTRRNVRGIVHRAYQDGLSVKDTAAAIREYAGSISVARSVLIARTEFVGLIQGGQLAATQIVAEATGTPYLKVWRTAPGAEYPRHELYDGLEGQTVEINATFIVGGDLLKYPGDPDGEPGEVCNCRCSLEFVTREERQAQIDAEQAVVPADPIFTPASEPQATFEPPATEIPNTGQLNTTDGDLLGDGGNVNLVYLVERDGEHFVVKPKPDMPRQMRENIPPGFDAERETSAYTMAKWMGRLNEDLGVNTPELVKGTVNETRSLARTLEDIKIMYPAVEVAVSEHDGGLVISLVRTVEGKRGMGYATNAVDELLRYADARGLKTVLTPEPVGEGGLTKSQLEEWYRHKGFVANTGRNKDFAFTESMIRQPVAGREVEPVTAAISRFIPDAQTGFESGYELDGISEGQIQNASLYDAIIGNLDRHANNYMRDLNEDLHLIDNGLTFPTENLGVGFNADIINARLTLMGPGLDIEETQLLSNLQIHRDEITAELRANGLDELSIKAMWERIENMLNTGEISLDAPMGGTRDIGPINHDPFVNLNLVDLPGPTTIDEGRAGLPPDFEGSLHERPATPLGGQNPPEDDSLGVPTANVRYLLQDIHAQGLSADDLNKTDVLADLGAAGYSLDEIAEAQRLMLAGLD